VSLPHPTKTRLAFADEIAAGRIRWYNFVRPVAFHAVTGYRVTAALDEFVAAGLASVPACAEGSSSVAELTPDGMAWVTRARIAANEGFGPVSTSPETVPAPAEAPTLTEIVEFLDPDGTLRAESTKDGSE
jgi:hypothetical protein